MNWKKTSLISLAILISGALLALLIFTTEPTATQSGATKQTPMLVNVTEVHKGDFTPTITATGVVEASEEVTLSSRVSGEVLARGKNFNPGTFVRKGEVLAQIDSMDYVNALSQRKSELRQAEADLTMELGRQEAAQKEYELYGDTLSEANRALVLRQPQLNTAKSEVESAEAAVRQAKLDLARTTIKAPFDAHVLSRNVNIGSQVGPGDELGQLVGMETYWVETTIPQSKLRWLDFRDEDDAEGSEVHIRNRTAWEEEEYRKGKLYRKLGTLDGPTRMAQVLITVDDPISYQPENDGKPSLMIGAFVEVDIEGRPLVNVVRLKREYIRDNETVWVKESNELQIRDVQIIFQDNEYAYITEGLSGDEQVVTTNLSTVTEGAPLRLETETDSTSTNNAE